MKKPLPIIVLLFFIVCLCIVFLKKDALFTTAGDTQSVAANIKTTQSLTTMTDFLERANASDDYAEGTFTIFAPTNEAFSKLPQETYTRLYNEKDKTLMIKTEDNHVVLGNYPSSTFNDGMKLTTVNGEVLTITKKDNQWYINNTVKIFLPDIASKNGVIHPIDTVLVPKN